MKHLKHITIFLLVLLMVSACGKPGKLRIATHIKGTAAETVAMDISDYLNDVGWDIEVLSGADYNSEKNLELIESGEVELAFISNNLDIQSPAQGINTILPLYPLIVYILHKTTGCEDLEHLLRGNKIGLVQDQYQFFESMFNYFGVPANTLDIVNVPTFDNVEDLLTFINDSSLDVLFSFSIPNSQHIRNMLSSNGWQLFSLDDIQFAGKGSAVEGFCLYFPRAYPYIIPKNVFGPFPEKPVYSLAMDMLLVTNAKSDSRWVHDLTRDILEGRQYLSQKNVLLAWVREHFDRDVLNFPLHEGAIDYLDRNEPSFYERYAEAFGVVFSILVVLAGVVSSFKRLKKERIDKYYRQAMTLQNINDLIQLEAKAIDQLEKDRLSADESFTIFLKIVEKRKLELRSSQGGDN